MERTIEVITPDKIEDFIKVFETFRNPPYYEAWTKEMIQEEYNDLWASEYKYVYGYYLNNECVGIIAFRPMRFQDRHPYYYEHPEGLAYIASIIVLEEHRKKGIETTLMEYALEVLKADRFKAVHMKTLEPHKSLLYDTAMSLGFKPIEGAIGGYAMERTVKEKSREENIIYLEKEL